jgi:hypothetical protein
MTARLMAARSWPGLSPAAWPSTWSSACRAWPASRTALSRAMMTTWDCRSRPARNNACVPGSLTARSQASDAMPSAARRVSASAHLTSADAESRHAPGIPAAPPVTAASAARPAMAWPVSATIAARSSSHGSPEPSGSRSSSPKPGGSSSSTPSASHSSSDTGSGRVITGSQHSGSACAPDRDTPRPGSAGAGTRGMHTTPFGSK